MNLLSGLSIKYFGRNEVGYGKGKGCKPFQGRLLSQSRIEVVRAGKRGEPLRALLPTASRVSFARASICAIRGHSFVRIDSYQLLHARAVSLVLEPLDELLVRNSSSRTHTQRL